MLKIKLSRQSERFLKKLIVKHFLQIDAKLTSLAQNSRPNDSIQLKGIQRFHRVDVGEYRIIYKTTDSELIIDVVGKRNDGDAYKKFFRKQ